MAFSFYQSLRTVPADLDEARQQLPALRRWQRFWRLELPFAMPGLIWNTMMSMSGGWFFVVASEAITVGNTTVTLPGIGSWLALAIERSDLARGRSGRSLTMALVILAYDQLLFRPIVAWADKFRFEQTASQDRAAVLVLRPVAPRPALLRAHVAAVRGADGASRISASLPACPAAARSRRPARRAVGRRGLARRRLAVSTAFAAWRGLPLSVGATLGSSTMS